MDDLIYAAAILDAKACIASYAIAAAPGTRVEIVVTTKYKTIAHKLRDVFAVGTVRKSGAVSYRWKCYNADAMHVLSTALPYMHAQRDTALLLVDFNKFKTRKRKYT